MKPKLEPRLNSDSKIQIESELKRTRKELENTKNALKHQVARCRHLVSAFSKKLAQKDAELKTCKETREKQLSAVIRALLVLEARLRREQKSIRSMLAERDALIRAQELALLAARLPDPSPEQFPFSDQAAPDLEQLLMERDTLIKSQQEEIERLRSLSLVDDLTPEQEDIADLLAERDALIKSQQEEIDRLRSITVDENRSKDEVVTKLEELEEETPNVECYAKPDLISSLCIEGDEKEAACQPDSLSSDAASTRACLGDNDTDSLCNCTITPPVVRGGLSVHDRSAFSPVPRSSNKFDSEPHSSPLFSNSVPDISKSNYSDRYDSNMQNDIQDNSFYNSRPSPSRDNRLPMGSFDINYQDNPVLQCVNQILLKDPDDIMEDQRSKKLPSIESPFVEIDDADQPFWLTNGTEESKLEETISTPEESPKPAVATSSPLEKYTMREEESPIIKGNRLSLSKLIELHNAARRLARRDHDGRKSVSMNDLSSAILIPRPHPPVPPKPRKSGRRVEFDMNRNSEARTAEGSLNPKSLLPPQPVYIDRSKLDIITKPSPLPFSNPQSTENGDQADNELYVISNSALDDEILQKLKGKNLKSFEIKLHRLAGEAMLQQQLRRQQTTSDGRSNPRPTLNKAMLNNINLLEAAAMLRQLREAGQQKKSSDGKQTVSPSMSHKARLRVAASVAQLLAQAQQQAREQQLREQQLKEQQLIEQQLREQQLREQELREQQLREQQVRELEQRQARDRPTEREEVSPSPTGEPPASPQSAEASSLEDGPSNSADKSPGTYDNFLEATGLSQKSIMTPSRMLNNHRSVVKPKDVKLRNKVRSAAIFERTIPPQVVGPTIKYWTEPYL